MKYLKGILDYGLKYVVDNEISLLGYSYLDWASGVANRKSTLGGCFTLGSGMISWISKKQSCVTLSTTEVEYVEASHEATWLWKLMIGLFNIAMEATCILCENQICIKLSENPMFHDNSKHIEIRYHYVVQKGVVRLQYGAEGRSEAPICGYQ
jgi:hypothetical protein